MTDNGLLSLACLPALTELRLSNCPRVTAAGVGALLAAAPALRRAALAGCRAARADECYDAAAAAAKARGVPVDLKWSRR